MEMMEGDSSVREREKTCTESEMSNDDFHIMRVRIQPTKNSVNSRMAECAPWHGWALISQIK